jgi:hypothetical protein
MVASMDLDAAITQTLIYHRFLHPTNLEGVGKVAICKEVRAKKGGKNNKKTTSSVEPAQPPSPRTDFDQAM